jgi:hypothetical protein
MKRREFLGLFGCVAAAWPSELGAQQAKVPVVGFLSGRSPEDSVDVLAAFRRGLRESGRRTPARNSMSFATQSREERTTSARGEYFRF